MARRLQSEGGEFIKGGSERWECEEMEAAESLFQCFEQVPDPRKAS